MEESTSREKILKKIRNALVEKTEPPFPITDQQSPVYPEFTDPLDVTFAKNLVDAGGKFVFSESIDEFACNLKSFSLEKDWPVFFVPGAELQAILKENGIPFVSDHQQINKASMALIGCEYLIARHGTVMVSSRVLRGRKLLIYPDILIVAAFSSQLVPDLKDAFHRLHTRFADDIPSMVTLITGPAQFRGFGDKTILNIHGPKELYLFLIDDGAGFTD
jgi:L-lactate dehydrogenase complex protein LldG